MRDGIGSTWFRAAVTGTAVALGACRGTSAGSPAPVGTAVTLDVPAPFDSTLRLAKYALRAVDGDLQLPRARPQMTSVSLHYSVPRRGGGYTQVAIIAAVLRPDSASAAWTRVEVSAWLLDVAHQITPAQRRAGVPVTAMTTNAPALNRPRPVTPIDTLHHASLGHVVEAFVQHGARRVP